MESIINNKKLSYPHKDDTETIIKSTDHLVVNNEFNRHSTIKHGPIEVAGIKKKKVVSAYLTLETLFPNGFTASNRKVNPYTITYTPVSTGLTIYLDPTLLGFNTLYDISISVDRTVESIIFRTYNEFKPTSSITDISYDVKSKHGTLCTVPSISDDYYSSISSISIYPLSNYEGTPHDITIHIRRKDDIELQSKQYTRHNNGGMIISPEYFNMTTCSALQISSGKTTRGNEQFAMLPPGKYTAHLLADVHFNSSYVDITGRTLAISVESESVYESESVHDPEDNISYNNRLSIDFEVNAAYSFTDSNTPSLKGRNISLMAPGSTGNNYSVVYARDIQVVPRGCGRFNNANGSAPKLDINGIYNRHDLASRENISVSANGNYGYNIKIDLPSDSSTAKVNITNLDRSSVYRLLIASPVPLTDVHTEYMASGELITKSDSISGVYYGMLEITLDNINSDLTVNITIGDEHRQKYVCMSLFMVYLGVYMALEDDSAGVNHLHAFLGSDIHYPIGNKIKSVTIMLDDIVYSGGWSNGGPIRIVDKADPTIELFTLICADGIVNDDPLSAISTGITTSASPDKVYTRMHTDPLSDFKSLTISDDGTKITIYNGTAVHLSSTTAWRLKDTCLHLGYSTNTIKNPIGCIKQILFSEDQSTGYVNDTVFKELAIYENTFYGKKVQVFQEYMEVNGAMRAHGFIARDVKYDSVSNILYIIDNTGENIYSYEVSSSKILSSSGGDISNTRSIGEGLHSYMPDSDNTYIVNPLDVTFNKHGMGFTFLTSNGLRNTMMLMRDMDGDILEAFPVIPNKLASLDPGILELTKAGVSGNMMTCFGETIEGVSTSYQVSHTEPSENHICTAYGVEYTIINSSSLYDKELICKYVYAITNDDEFVYIFSSRCPNGEYNSCYTFRKCINPMELQFKALYYTGAENMLRYADIISPLVRRNIAYLAYPPNNDLNIIRVRAVNVVTWEVRTMDIPYNLKTGSASYLHRGGIQFMDSDPDNPRLVWTDTYGNVILIDPRTEEAYSLLGIGNTIDVGLGELDVTYDDYSITGNFLNLPIMTAYDAYSKSIFIFIWFTYSSNTHVIMTSICDIDSLIGKSHKQVKKLDILSSAGTGYLISDTHIINNIGTYRLLDTDSTDGRSIARVDLDTKTMIQPTKIPDLDARSRDVRGVYEVGSSIYILFNTGHIYRSNIDGTLNVFDAYNGHHILRHNDTIIRRTVNSAGNVLEYRYMDLENLKVYDSSNATPVFITKYMVGDDSITRRGAVSVGSGLIACVECIDILSTIDREFNITFYGSTNGEPIGLTIPIGNTASIHNDMIFYKRESTYTPWIDKYPVNTWLYAMIVGSEYIDTDEITIYIRRYGYLTSEIDGGSNATRTDALVHTLVIPNIPDECYMQLMQINNELKLVTTQRIYNMDSTVYAELEDLYNLSGLELIYTSTGVFSKNKLDDKVSRLDNDDIIIGGETVIDIGEDNIISSDFIGDRLITTIDTEVSSLPYTTIFDGNGNTSGNVPIGGGYSDGNLISIPGNDGNLAKTGFLFAGWSLDGATPITDPMRINGEDITLYTVWGLAVTVTYDGDGYETGSIPEPVITLANTQYTISTEESRLVKGRFVFNGWSLDGINPVSGNITLGSTDLVIRPLWRSLPSITFDGNGSDSGSVPVTQYYNSGLTVYISSPDTLRRSGYNFKGWSLDKVTTLTNSRYTITDDDVILYAIWAAIEFTISFDGYDSTGGTLPADIKLRDGEYTDLPGIGDVVKNGVPIDGGETFIGWSTSRGGDVIDDVYVCANEHVVLYARWISAICIETECEAGDIEDYSILSANGDLTAAWGDDTTSIVEFSGDDDEYKSIQKSHDSDETVITKFSPGSNIDGIRLYTSTMPDHYSGAHGIPNMRNISISQAPFLTELMIDSSSWGGDGYAGTALDLSNNKSLSELSIKVADGTEAIDMLQLTKLTDAYLCGFKHVDVSNSLELEKLRIENCEDTSLDISIYPKLTSIWIEDCKYETINMMNNNIEWVHFNGMPDLTTLNLQWLINSRILHFDNVPILDNVQFSNSSLYILTITRCGISSLDISNAININQLHIADESLTYIDVSKQFNLTSLHLDRNYEMIMIDVTHNPGLGQLTLISSHKLTSLDISKNIELRILDITESGISSLDISNNPDINHLYASRSSINTITVTHILDTLIANGGTYGELRLDDVAGTVDVSKVTTLRTQGWTVTTE